MEIIDIQNAIKENPAILLYFYNDSCAPCKVLRPKVQELVKNEFPEMDFLLINAEQYLTTAAEYGVFASPTILVFFEAKEYIRESKNISISELHSKIDRIYQMIF
ncbi:MAG: thioredoxin family protein [Lentimicrobiaceae bacterium]|jgi:thiol-disulfide isomerase/thioredoxin